MKCYYNEHDKHAAAWLRQLIADGLISDGEVDERSIADVQPKDLVGFTRCHFFAGIGGWDHALQIAGWPGDQPVWTGSCPCQPFSVAGKRKGENDERHLWPEFYRLIAECRPEAIFSEQVASAETVGTQLEAAFVAAVQRGDYAAANRAANKLVKSPSLGDAVRWIDGVFADLEKIGYSCWASDLPAACVGAPHIRQRLFWVADSGSEQSRERHDAQLLGKRASDSEQAWVGGISCGLADAHSDGLQERIGDGRIQPGERRTSARKAAELSGNAWGDYTLTPCRDGKTRRIKSGLEPLVDGLPGRVGLLRGYGNAIVPQVAAKFVTAFCDITRVGQKGGGQ